MLGRHIARKRDRRRRAEQPHIDAGNSEGGALGGHGEIARRDELAACRRRHAVNPGDDGDRQIDDGLHDAAALGEQGFVVILARIGAHLLEVVPGAEGLAGRRENDAAHGVVILDIVESRLQRRQHLLGQGVEPGGPVENQRHDSIPILAQENGLAGNGQLGTHDGFLLIRARCLPDPTRISSIWQ